MALLLLVILAPALAAQGLLVYLNFRSQQQEEQLANVDAARAAARLFSAVVSDLGRQAGAVGQVMIALGGSDPDALNRVLARQVAEYPPLHDIIWVSPPGIILAADKPEMVGIDLHDREYLQRALAAPDGQWALSDLIQSRLGPDILFVLARAIRRPDGTCQGLVVASVIPERLAQQAMRIDRLREGTLTLFDRQGRLVFREPSEALTWARRDPALWKDELVSAALAGQEVVGTYWSPFDGRKRLVARVPIPELGWVAGGGRETGMVSGPLWRSIETVAGLNLLALGASLGAALLMSRRAARDVEALRRHVEALGEGSDLPLPASAAIVELRELDAAFDAMVVRRRQAEQALRDSQHDLNRAQAVAQTGSWRMNVRRNELLWSDQTYRLFEVPLGTSLTYETFQAAVHPEDRARVDQAWVAALRGEPYDIEHRILVNGRVKWVRERAEMEFDADGGLLGGFGTAQDITERKTAEQAVLETQQRLRAIIDNAEAIVWLKDLEGRFVIANRYLTGVLGLPAERVVGRTVFELFPPDLARPYAENDRRVLEEGRALEFDESARLDDGEHTYVSIKFPLRDLEGRVYGVGAICTDITERKRAEDALNEAHQQALWLARFPDENPSPVMRVSADGTVLYCNASACELPEWACAVGQPLQALLRPLAAKAMAQGREVQQDVHMGNRFYTVWAMPFPGEGYANLYGRDITERRAAEEQLRRAVEDLARSNRDLEQFAYVASHDLQEPLRMVTGYLELLEQNSRDKLDEEARTFMAFAVDGTHRMQRLVRDLLAYSRLATRARPLEPTPMREAYETAVANLGAIIRETGAALSHDELPVVWADQTQMALLLQNLLANAVKFRAEQRPPQIHLAAERQPGGWRFAVRDNGIGIDARHAERIFLIFQRLHPRGRYPGSGIGLAVCKRVVERHGGRIWVESRVGEGATFFFTLPDKETADVPRPAGAAG